ncbi:unnamed protein product [Cyclocybe aegerita]|uniref:Uncharacterized protein n=1 Tax=Cyclocybe aegerita TaxID=1973307 RepID=A0A8S0XK96_CYCAE|nr:unnamed protein product [Cyclocybe aegerita]
MPSLALQEKVPSHRRASDSEVDSFFGLHYQQVNLHYRKLNTMVEHSDKTNETDTLPPLGRVATPSTEQTRLVLHNLRNLYPFPTLPPSLAKWTIQHLVHDTSAPDSGYASAEEDEDEDFNTTPRHGNRPLRADPLERVLAIKWTGFVPRSDVWVTCDANDESEERGAILEDAVTLPSAFIGGEEQEDVSLTRTFIFPCTSGSHQKIRV